MEQKQRVERIFFGIAVLNMVIVYVMLIVSKGNFLYKLTYGESNFCDFWSHIYRLLTSPNIYATDADAIFPPLAYLFLKIFAYPLSFKMGAETEIWDLSESGYGILMIVMYLLLFAWFLMIAVHNYYKAGTFLKESVLLFILLFSYLTWGFAIERGNLVLYAMVFLMLGLAFRDSSNKVLREISLICVAISAGFKLYPALFGLIWIAEKRYKEAGRLVLYGLAAFFVPFLFVDSFANYLSTFTQYLNKNDYSHASVWGLVFNMFGNNSYTQMLCRIVVAAIIVWAVFALFMDGVNWKTLTLLTATQTMILPEQYIYTYVFIMIPLVCFLNEAGRNKLDYLYAVLFAALFSAPPVGGGRGRLNFWIWMILALTVSVNEIVFFIRKRKTGQAF
ncbi:MAG: glycosyltransferase 87 family protein [Eubacterium sp.]|nr:glycosyltransferase 87 family protein [Eubacterium sp.]